MTDVGETALQDDPRWRQLHDTSWICPCCNETHGGIFDLAVHRPDYCPKDMELSENAAVGSSSHFVSEDLCVLNGESFFVRGVLIIPIQGAAEASFGYGVWSSLSEKNFERFVDSFDAGNFDPTVPWFGWFSNRLKGYPDTLNLKCKVLPQADRQRPLIELEPTDHPLAAEQQGSMTFDRLLEIYALNGHDMRAALSR